ncbi:MAG: hypothetical protein FD143_1192 [Ignavibacteria bacterium]|nr:MAG: hypothetical protein FD143_1192 [Ignavibacteria bacterium]KAF0160702.1 MAG: hypothetical protein FD188_1478 [Ignavibacteria bacterium]
MNAFRKILNRFLSITQKYFSGKSNSAPLLILKKEKTEEVIKEYTSIEDAIADLENDSNVPKEKIEKLKSSMKNLKLNTSIKIRDGEIIK